MRLFIAITISDEAKEELIRIQNELDKRNSDLKLIPKESIHLTLKFIGEYHSPELIAEIIGPIINNTSVTELTLSEVGAFPSPKAARVVWVGADESEPVLSKLSNEIEEALEELDIPKEDRSFVPHITIARTKERQLIKLPTSVVPVRFEVKNIILFSSDTLPQGAKYTEQFKFPLKQ